MTDAERRAPQSNPIIRFREKPTRAKAIKAFCCQCMGCTDDSLEPGFRRDIAECDHGSCALHAYRPFQRADEPDDDDNMPVSPLWVAHPTAQGWMWNTATNEVISDAEHQDRLARGAL